MNTLDQVQPARRNTVGNALAMTALVLSVLAVVYLLLVPVYSGVSISQDSTGMTGTATTSATLIEVNGGFALLPVLFPVAICAGTLALRNTRIARAARAVAAVVLLAFSVVAGFSIGLFYLPAAFAMVVAARAKA